MDRAPLLLGPASSFGGSDVVHEPSSWLVERLVSTISVGRGQSTLLLQSALSAAKLMRATGERRASLFLFVAVATRSPSATILHQIVAPYCAVAQHGHCFTRIFQGYAQRTAVAVCQRALVGLQ